MGIKDGLARRIGPGDVLVVSHAVMMLYLSRELRREPGQGWRALLKALGFPFKDNNAKN